jgi:hypothetical protein
MKSKGPDTRILASAGIDVTDCGGWLGHNTSFDQPVSVRSMLFSFYCNNNLTFLFIAFGSESTASELW